MGHLCRPSKQGIACISLTLSVQLYVNIARRLILMPCSLCRPCHCPVPWTGLVHGVKHERVKDGPKMPRATFHQLDRDFGPLLCQVCARGQVHHDATLGYHGVQSGSKCARSLEIFGRRSCHWQGWGRRRSDATCSPFIHWRGGGKRVYL